MWCMMFVMNSYSYRRETWLASTSGLKWELELCLNWIFFYLFVWLGNRMISGDTFIMRGCHSSKREQVQVGTFHFSCVSLWEMIYKVLEILFIWQWKDCSFFKSWRKTSLRIVAQFRYRQSWVDVILFRRHHNDSSSMHLKNTTAKP